MAEFWKTSDVKLPFGVKDLSKLVNPFHWIHRAVDFHVWEKAKNKHLIQSYDKARISNVEYQLLEATKKMQQAIQKSGFDPEKFDEPDEQFFRETQREITHGMEVDLAERVRSSFITDIEGTIKKTFLLPTLTQLHADTAAKSLELKRQMWKEMSKEILAQRFNKNDPILRDMLLSLGNKVEGYALTKDKNIAGGIWAHCMCSTFKDLLLGSDADSMAFLRECLLEFNPDILRGSNPNYYTHLDISLKGTDDLTMDQAFECLTAGVTDHEIAKKILFDDSISIVDKRALQAKFAIPANWTRYGGLEWNRMMEKNVDIMMECEQGMHPTEIAKVLRAEAYETLAKGNQDLMGLVWNFNTPLPGEFGNNRHLRLCMEAYAKFHVTSKHGDKYAKKGEKIAGSLSWARLNQGYKNRRISATTYAFEDEPQITGMSADNDVLKSKTKTSGLGGKTEVNEKIKITPVNMTEREAICQNFEDVATYLYGKNGLLTEMYDKRNHAFKMPNGEYVSAKEFVDDKIAKGKFTSEFANPDGREMLDYMYGFVETHVGSRKEFFADYSAYTTEKKRVNQIKDNKFSNLPFKKRST